MSLAARLLLFGALLCSALGLAAATSSAAFTRLGCHHETAQGAPAASLGEAITPAAAPLAASFLPERSGSLPRTARPSATLRLSHAGGASVPSGATCCLGNGCLMSCHWVAPALDLAPRPDGAGQRLGFAPSPERPAQGPEVQLPPPRHRA